MTSFVLLHGGGMGGWIWQYVRALLEARGHRVYTPTFTGFGERVHLTGRDVGNRTHVTDVVNVLKYEDIKDAVLVAYSYSGAVAPGIVAQARDRIARVIYLDAVVPRAGERVASILGFATEEEMADVDALLAAGQGPVGSGVDEQVRAMAREHPHMMSEERERWMLDNLTDQPMHAVSGRIPVGAESIDLPVHYIAAKHSMMPMMHERARNLGWTVHDHPGDHALLVGDPEGTTAILLAIAGGGA